MDKLQSFGRHDFVKIAPAPSRSHYSLCARRQRRFIAHVYPHQVPLVDPPHRVAVLPDFDLPLIPAPLPSKWHMQFLPPLHVYQDHTPQSASDRSVVTAISLKVRIQMQQALDQIVARRRVFWGSVFQ
jgi:hypothetical protein